jgi:hypothetical protein
MLILNVLDLLVLLDYLVSLENLVIERRKRLGTLYWRVPNLMVSFRTELLQLNLGTSGLDGLLQVLSLIL